MSVEHIRLEVFEHLVYTRKLDEAGAELMLMINRLRSGGEFIGHSKDSPTDKMIMHSRLAAAIVALFGDPRFHLSEKTFEKLGIHHSTFCSIFDNSIFESCDMIAPALIENPYEMDPTKFDFGGVAEKRAKFLLLYTYTSLVDMNFPLLCQVAAKTMFPLYIGMLTNPVILATKAHLRKEALMEQAFHFKDIQISDELLPPIADVFMYCSYANSILKHDIKRVISASLRRDMIRRGVKELSNQEVKIKRANRHSEKPIMMVPLDWMNTNHAMYRCFAPSIKQLREEFYTIGYIRKSIIDPNAETLFDEMVYIPEGTVSLDTLAGKILETHPDVVYYPSIGMSPWWVALCQMRLAPIQVMTLGHPASSFSSQIDYVIAEEGQAPDQSLLTEKIVTIPVGGLQFIEVHDYNKEVPEFEVGGESFPDVHIAVPAMVAKITVPFLETLKLIREKAFKNHDVVTVYHFYPNLLGVAYWQARRRLLEWFPNAIIHTRAGYREYMETLRTCHLHFSCFPFGGTNSNIDSFLLGIPVLAMWGAEPHTAFDSLMLKRVGTDYLSVDSAEKYVEQGLKLVVDPYYRLKARNDILASDVRKEFFGERTGPQVNAFLKAMKAIYDHHEYFKNTGVAPEWQTYHEPMP